MKSNTKKRLIAFMLCMVLVLSSATSAFADEPQNTDSQSQTEAVAEPAADEATGDEANTTDIEIPSEKEWSVQVGNATVKVKGSADALPENAQLSVSEITSEDEVKEIEKAVEEKAAVVKAYVVGDELKEIDLKLGDLTDAERQIILDGCLINYYRATK